VTIGYAAVGSSAGQRPHSPGKVPRSSPMIPTAALPPPAF